MKSYRPSLRSAFAILTAATALGGGIYGYGAITGGGGSTPGLHNVWVDTNGGTCTYSSTPAAYSDASACTMAAAYQAVAANGSGTVGVVSGTYSSATSIAANASATGYTTFVPEGGDVVFSLPVCIGSDGHSGCSVTAAAPSWVKLDSTGGTGKFVYRGGVVVSYDTSQPTHIVVNGGHTAWVEYNSVNDLTVSNMEVGPECCSADGIHAGWGDVSGEPQTANVTIDGNYIHGIHHLCAEYPGQGTDGVGPITCPGDTGIHVDCMQFDTADNLTIDRNICYDNGEQGIFLGGTGSGGPAGVSCPTTGVGCYEGTINIDNNLVGLPVDTGAGNNPFILGRNVSPAQPSFSATATVNIKYNSIPSNYLIDQGTDFPGTINAVGNIGQALSDKTGSASSCTDVASTVTSSHNFFITRTCDPSDTLITSYPYVSTSTTSPDLRLVSGSPEIGGGDPADFPTTDVFGRARISPPNAGADQTLTAGGSSGSGMTSSLSAKTVVTSDGQTREYRTYKPSGSCPSSGCPLVVFLNGSISATCAGQGSFDAMMDCDLGTAATGQAGKQISDSGWTTEADTTGAIVLFLEGAPDTCHNSGVCTVWFGTQSDDGQFIADAVSQVETSGTVGANIDTSKVYLTGFSGGGSATSWVSCGSMQGANRNTNSNYKTPQSLFAGFGLWAAGQLGTANTEGVSPSCSWPSSPIPTIQVLSTADSTATYLPSPWRQNFACSTQSAGTQCFVRVTTTASAYVSKWGCGSDTLTTTNSGVYAQDAKHTFDPCSSSGAAFEWDQFGFGLSVGQGPGHNMAQYNTAMSIPALMWGFWQAH